MVALVAGACASSPGTSPDAGGADVGAWPEPPRPPLPPTPIVSPDCRGRASSDVDGTRICWSLDPTEACPSGEVRHAAETECQRIGAECTEWPTPPPDVSVRYVRVSGTGNGTSASSPIGTINAAIADLGSTGGAVLVASGRYAESVQLPANVSVIGACARDVTLASNGPAGPRGVVQLTGAASALRNVTITPRNGRGITITTASSDAVIEGVIVRGATGGGISADGADNLTIRDVLVIDMVGDGAGIELLSRTTALLERVVVDGVAGVGIVMASVGTTVTASNLVVNRVRRFADRSVGYGIYVEVGATFEGERVAITNGSRAALYVLGTTAMVRDLFVHHMDDEAGHRDSLGAGIRVEGRGSSAGRLDVERAYIGDVDTVGMLALEGAVLSASDVVVDGVVLAGADGNTGFGVSVGRESTATLRRITMRGVANSHVSSIETGAVVDIEDLSASRLTSLGRGQSILIASGAQLRLARAFIEHGSRSLLVDKGSNGVVSDLEIATDARSVEGAEWCVIANRGARLQLQRARLVNCTSVALAGLAEAFMELDDVDISGVRPNPRYPQGGGMILSGVTTTGSRVRVRDTHGVAVLMGGGSASFTDLDIDDISPLGCGAECPGFDGIGVSVSEHSVLRLSKTRVSRARAIGVARITPARLVIEDALIADGPLGYGATAAVAEEQTLTRVEFDRVQRSYEYRVLPIPRLGFEF